MGRPRNGVRLREEAFSCVPRLRAGLFCDLSMGEFCPRPIPPYGMAAVSPTDKSRKDGALSPVAPEKASSLSPPPGGQVMPPALREETHTALPDRVSRIFLSILQPRTPLCLERLSRDSSSRPSPAKRGASRDRGFSGELFAFAEFRISPCRCVARPE
jgi:hypothetical protein